MRILRTPRPSPRSTRPLAIERLEDRCLLSYALTDLGLGNEPWGINAKGHVVGMTGGISHPFFWDGTIHDLGTLGGNFGSAQGINDYDQVTGFASTATNATHAFYWDAVNGMQDLGTLGGPYSYGYGINDTPSIVGSSNASAGAPTPEFPNPHRSRPAGEILWRICPMRWPMGFR
jgi:probable HAF family extracellular repeat protein